MPGDIPVNPIGIIAGYRTGDLRRVSYLPQPGIPVEDTTAVAAALRSRFPALRGPDPDAFCYAASDRTETTRSVAASCDMVLVLGAEDDADTRYLAGLARSCHAKAHARSPPRSRSGAGSPAAGRAGGQ